MKSKKRGEKIIKYERKNTNTKKDIKKNLSENFAKLREKKI